MEVADNTQDEVQDVAAGAGEGKTSPFAVCHTDRTPALTDHVQCIEFRQFHFHSPFYFTSDLTVAYSNV